MTAPSRFAPGPLSRRDLAVVTAVTVVELMELRTGGPADPRSAAMGTVGLLLSAAQGLPLLWMRRRPAVVLTVVSAAFVLHAVLLDPVPPYGAWVALAVLAAHREIRAAAAAGCGVVAACVVAYLGTDGPAEDVALPALVTGAVTVTAQLVRERRARSAALVREAAADERLRIARDLHDVLGHSLSAIAVQSSTGRLALEAGRPEVVRESLAAIEAASRASMSEVRAVLSRFREDTTPGLSALDDLVRSTPSTVEVALVRRGDLSEVPDDVGRTAYRVLQEALTNTVRHAAPCKVEASVRRRADLVEIEVRDDGTRPVDQAAAPTGHGLVGMRERVAALGGELDSGPVAGGGWRVRATLPIAGTASP